MAYLRKDRMFNDQSKSMIHLYMHEMEVNKRKLAYYKKRGWNPDNLHAKQIELQLLINKYATESVAS